MLVLRINRKTARVDTVTTAATMTFNTGNAAPMVEEGAVGSSAGKRMYMVGIQVADQLAMFADGWIAVAHNRPYRVTWCPPGPGAKCTTSGELEPSRAMNNQEKAAYLDWASGATNWPPTKDISQTAGWPQMVPAFAVMARGVDVRSVFPAPDGRVVIQRVPTSDAPPMRYDIVDRRGVVAARLTLPRNHAIVGFGKTSVYVAVTDADGIRRLQRHAWP